MATPEARATYPAILDIDWEALGYVNRPKGSWGLNEEIHDIFQYNLPGRATPIWDKQSSSQYRVLRAPLETVFKLATKLLLCSASLDWFYYLIYAPRKRTDPLVQHNGEDVYEYRRDDTPMRKRHEMARAALKRFALTHTFELEDFDDDDYGDEGRTRPRQRYSYAPQGVNIRNDSPKRTSGIGPQIGISRTFVRQLMETVMDGSPGRDRMFTLVTKMAVTKVHEIAHGVAMTCSFRLFSAAQREYNFRMHAAVNDLRRVPKELNINEDLLEDENLAEPGYSWENFVFGGNIELLGLDSDSPLVFIKWPNFTKGARDLRRGGWKASATQYIVPWRWVINVNSQGWWNNVEEGDDTALYIMKIVGFRQPCPSPDVDEDWNASQSSEGIWPTDEKLSHGQSTSQRVSRAGPGATIEDPSAAGANTWEAVTSRARRDNGEAGGR